MVIVWPNPTNPYHHLSYLYDGRDDFWLAVRNDGTILGPTRTRGQILTTCLFDARKAA